MSTHAGMSNDLDGEHWTRLEALERRRRNAIAEHEQAMRELYVAADRDPIGIDRKNFQRYCDAAENLEHTLVELQLFRWSTPK